MVREMRYDKFVKIIKYFNKAPERMQRWRALEVHNHHFIYAVVIFSILLIFITSVDARDYRVRKKRNGYTVDVAINRNPPVLGANAITIEIEDSQGNNVSGATVRVNYYMPPMPGMPPMNYTIPALPGANAYTATMDLIMTGPWNVIIKVKDRDKSWRVVFPIDVR